MCKFEPPFNCIWIIAPDILFVKMVIARLQDNLLAKVPALEA